MFKKSTLAIVLALALSPGLSSATAIVGQGLPTDNANLTGGTVIDFESTGVFNGASLTISGVTITGNTDIEVDSDYAGSYNTRGTYHMTNHGDQPTHFQFDFGAPVSAFAFLWGAADVDWTLRAFAGVTLLETQVVGPTQSSNAGDYFGIANSGITSATLDISSGTDYVFIDNFTFQSGGTPAVPEPASLALLGLGLAGLGFARRKNQRAA